MTDLITVQPEYDTVERVPSQLTYSARLQTWMGTGQEAIALVRRYLPTSGFVALDIETYGLDATRFDLKCVTASWVNNSDAFEGEYVSVMLDPRHADEAETIRDLTDRAQYLVFHGGTFDVPPLCVHGLMSLESISKVWDTLVMARQLLTADLGGRSLESLVDRYTHLKDSSVKIRDTFAALGLTMDEGYRDMDISSPVYCMGAMADTLATLLLAPIMHAEITRTYTDYYARNFPHVQWDHAARTSYLITREQKVNRAMLRRSALGIKVDQDYLETYSKEVEESAARVREDFKKVGIDPDSGTANREVLELLASRGELPADWERTETGMLKADKKALESLDNPLVTQIVDYRYKKKVLGYLHKVASMSQLTGRLYPQVQVLGASATGRMSYISPELQQFPKEARPILVPDEGESWDSVDWSSIEPVVIGNAAQDMDFIRPFEEGFDLYVPIIKAMGLIPQDMPEQEAVEHPARKRVKRVFLGTLYGQGSTSLAKQEGISQDEARSLMTQIFDHMPGVRDKIANIKAAAEREGQVSTLDGRVLSIPEFNGQYAAHKAGNYVTQGTAYSLMSELIAVLYDRGLSDAVYLAVHDEVIVDHAHLEEIQKIMETPPQWLNDAAGRTVMLKSDSNHLPTSWEYV